MGIRGSSSVREHLDAHCSTLYASDSASFSGRFIRLHANRNLSARDRDEGTSLIAVRGRDVTKSI